MCRTAWSAKQREGNELVIIQADSPDGEDLAANDLARARGFLHLFRRGIRARLSAMPPLQRILLPLYLLAISVALLTTCMLVGSGLRQLQPAREQAHAQVKALAAAAAAGLQQQVEQDLVALKVLARKTAAQDGGPARCEGFVIDFSRLDGVLVHVTLRDLRGELICALSSVAGSARPAVGGPFIGPNVGTFVGNSASRQQQPNGRWLTWLTQPLFDGAGNRLGSLNLQLDLLQLSEQLRALMPKNALAEVLSRQQTIVARSQDAAAYIGRVKDAADLRRGPREGEFHDEASAEAGAREMPRLYYLVAVPGTDWRLLASLPRDEVFADYERQLRHVLGLGLALLLLITWLSWRIGLVLLWPAMRD
jgi:hypothetical protein